MGNRRMGLGRLEALLEAVDRDLNLANTTLTSPTITTAAALSLATEAITGAGACSILTPVTFLDTTGGAAAHSLAASTVAGQVKTIVMSKDGGDSTLTIANSAGAADVYTFANVGESITLINGADEDGTIIGWVELARGSGAVNATAAFDGPAASAS